MELPIVTTILNNYWDWKIPVDLEGIAQKLNIIVNPINPFDDHKYKGCSGAADITDGKRMIYYNLLDSPNRQRFTKAHEIGHHLLGHVTNEQAFFRDHPKEFNANVSSYLERDANNFAAQLLMPSEAIKTMLFKNNVKDIEQLASEFQVSEAAMYYRLKNLGYLSL